MDQELDKKINIIKAANKLFSHYGYSKTSISDIAKEAEVGKGTVYYYFSSKEDIFAELLKTQLALVEKKITKEISEQHTAANKLKVFFDILMEMLQENAPLVLQAANEESNMYLRKINNVHCSGKLKLKDILRNIIVAGIKTGEMRSDIDIDAYCDVMYRWFLHDDENFLININENFLEQITQDYKILGDLLLNGLLVKEN